MNVKILVDNYTNIDEYYLGEPAVSYLIIDGDTKVLFDTGYSDIFIKNALKMSESLKDISFVVLSHGHNDHTGGLKHLIDHLTNQNKRPEIVTHPETFLYKEEDEESIGSFINEDEVRNYLNIRFTKEPLWLTENLVFLGEIERTNNFENKTPIGKYLINNQLKDDYQLDDSALVYTSPDGLVIITGCSHAGICNIIEYAKKICNEDRIVDVIGGFHMLTPTQDQISGTLEYFKKLNVNTTHPCHCTSLNFKIKLSNITSVEEVGVGQLLYYR